LIFKGLRGSPEANCPVDYAGLLRMAAGQNKFGGGQGQPVLLTNMLPFHIKTLAKVA